MTAPTLETVDWRKQGGLVPAIVQDAESGQVLMLGYMNEEAFNKTLSSGQVHFFSRSRQRLWMKGESSGNVLRVAGIEADCDNDTLLVSALAAGPVCHTGAHSCFGTQSSFGQTFLGQLDATIAQRGSDGGSTSYTAGLLSSGIAQVARKVGEEAVEVSLAALSEDDKACLGEAADLQFHLLVLLHARGLGLKDLVQRLQERSRVVCG